MYLYILYSNNNKLYNIFNDQGGQHVLEDVKLSYGAKAGVMLSAWNKLLVLAKRQSQICSSLLDTIIRYMLIDFIYNI